MPLKQGPGKKAFKENVEKEMESGKPQKQSLAIAFNVQRKNKRKKLADGGEATKKTLGEIINFPGTSPSPSPSPVKKAMGGEIRPAESDSDGDYDDDAGGKYSDGGRIMSPMGGSADRIRERMKMRRFADGGEVDLSRNADEDSNLEDDLSFEALKKENYSESEGLSQMESPEDSNLHGHDLSDEDDHERSMIDEIRRIIRSRPSR